ncbi:hypothetical protein GE300_14750 [Rhodobacteraceae bacterium 2CG4]|uniref:Uncharacterized protein n=1 Tax=Halovulum marinum TaxID=2662447 RepID=A0A6L5Z2Q4_9RHOB|nr:hypothetical protein [Halovulum marinum]MSU90861.1 hypothetical protein [Halovulum marinum]
MDKKTTDRAEIGPCCAECTCERGSADCTWIAAGGAEARPVTLENLGLQARMELAILRKRRLRGAFL